MQITYKLESFMYRESGEHVKMRVRPGGKKGKKSVKLDMLSRADQTYANGLPAEVISHTQQWSRKVSVKQGVVEDVPRVACWNNFGHELKDGVWQHTKVIAPNVRKAKFLMHGDITIEDNNINHLLKGILLFKGITFDIIERDMRLFNTEVRAKKLDKIGELIGVLRNQLFEASTTTDEADVRKKLAKLQTLEGYWTNCKPFAIYKVSTKLQPVIAGGDFHERVNYDCLITTIKVVKTYRNISPVSGNTVLDVNKTVEQTGMTFDGKSCYCTYGNKRIKISKWFELLTMREELNKMDYNF